MSGKLRLALVAAALAVFGLFFGGSALAQAEPPPGAPDDCVENVMDLPALNVCKDAQGRHILDLPAIGELREPATPAPNQGALPKTGVETEDFAAIGLAALAGGAVLLRRLRLAVS